MASSRGGGLGPVGDPDAPLFLDGRDDASDRAALSKGNMNPKVMSFIRDDWIRKQLKAREAEFTEYDSNKIFVGTWNVNGKKPGESIESWLVPDPRADMADIYAVGFQEIVDLNAQNVIADGQSHSRSSQWEEQIGATLNGAAAKRRGGAGGKDGERYHLVLQKHLVGILLCVFVKDAHRRSVRDVQGDTAGVGLMGVMGNKGGAAVRFKFRDSTFCFICSHLAAHRGNVAGRNSDYANILEKIVFKDEVVANSSYNVDGGGGGDGSGAGDGESKGEGFGASSAGDGGDGDGDGDGDDGGRRFDEVVSDWGGDLSGRPKQGFYGALDHDFVVWLGDLNYRIEEGVSLETCYDAIGRRDLRFLQDRDQLNRERAAKRVFHDFEELPLTFLPTYKYIPHTDDYDRRPDKKMRAPAWCDRVLWRLSPHLFIQDHSQGCSSLQ